MGPFLLLLAGAAVLYHLKKKGEETIEAPDGKECTRPGQSWSLSEPEGSSFGWPPPGLPPNTRKPSARGMAYPLVQAAATAENLGPEFVTVMLSMCRHESGGRLGMPAWTFDDRPASKRPKNQCAITAWGCFQWQQSWPQTYWNGPQKSYWMTVEQETAGAVGVYAQHVRASPGRDPFVAWILHSSPANGRKAMREGLQSLSPKYQKKLEYYRGVVAKYKKAGYV